MRRNTLLVRATLLAALALTLVLPSTAVRADDDSKQSARVTYVTGSTVYLDAGLAEGLRAGMELVLMRGGATVALVEVKDVSTHRASCTIVERGLEPLAGDEVRFEAAETDPADAAAGAAVAGGAVVAGGEPPPPTAGRNRRGGRIHGRVGLRYLRVNDGLSDDSGYAQPALDLRLDGANLAGTAWGFSVDARARRTYRDRADGERDDENRSRLYRLAAMRRGIHDRWDLTVGRQFSPSFAAVSIFDGVSADYRGQRWAVGAFSGTQPDAADFSFSDRIREHGIYFRYHGRPADGRSWQFTTGLVGSYDESEVNREFFYLQGRYNDRKLAVYFAQEVDFNRDWKSDEGESSVEPTSTFVSLRYQVSGAFELHTGYDNRRNVRLYRDRVTPITEFDDSFRRGVWAGASVRVFEHFRFGLDARTNGGGDAGDAETYSFLFGAHRLGRTNVNLNLRASRYTNELVEGWLGALNAGLELGRRVYLQAYGGVRDEENLALLPADNTLSWFGLDLELALARPWYLLLSAERTDGDFEEVDQYYANVSYRF